MGVSLKRRKPVVYISLTLYALLSTFIIIESCIEGGLSSTQSHLFANIAAFIVNMVEGPQVPETIKPTSVKEFSNSAVLGKDDKGNTQIALGTTTLVSYEVTYPTKEKKDVYDYTYSIEKVDGVKDDYNVIASTRNSGGKFYIDVRIVANAMNSDYYLLNLRVADELTYACPFNIVSLPAPKTFTAKETTYTLKQGETKQVNIRLDDPKRTDTDLRRYYDQTLLSHTSSDASIATIDEYGVIHGHHQGHTTVYYGEQSIEVTVSEESIVKPATNTLHISKSESSKDPSLLDYDFVFAKDENPDHYSALLYASFEDETLEDQSVTWMSSDPLSVKLAPYAYDEEGFPIYHDEDGKPCVRACGYRTNKDTTITCISNADPSIQSTYPLSISEAKPISMKLNIAGPVELELGKQTTITSKFTPQNTFNAAIHVETDGDVLSIKNNDSTSVTLLSQKEGKTHVVVTSVANPTLKAEFDVNVKAPQAIDDHNYEEFHQSFRKFLGHFLLFAVTAVAGFVFFFTFFDTLKLRMALGLPITLGSGLFIAGLSEIIQYYVPQRSGTWMDVGIDFSGYLAGTLICLAIFGLIMLIVKKKKKNQDEKTQ